MIDPFTYESTVTNHFEKEKDQSSGSDCFLRCPDAGNRSRALRVVRKALGKMHLLDVLPRPSDCPGVVAVIHQTTVSSNRIKHSYKAECPRKNPGLPEEYPEVSVIMRKTGTYYQSITRIPASQPLLPPQLQELTDVKIEFPPLPDLPPDENVDSAFIEGLFEATKDPSDQTPL